MTHELNYCGIDLEVSGQFKQGSRGSYYDEPDPDEFRINSITVIDEEEIKLNENEIENLILEQYYR